jgi:hypothetical protein
MLKLAHNTRPAVASEQLRSVRSEGVDGATNLTTPAPGPAGQALRDPSLRVGYYRTDNDDYVDRNGRPLTVSPGQAVTVVERDGRTVAALVHDPAVREERHVLAAVTSAAALELDNQRLAAEVRAQLVEVRRATSNGAVWSATCMTARSSNS